MVDLHNYQGREQGIKNENDEKIWSGRCIEPGTDHSRGIREKRVPAYAHTTNTPTFHAFKPLHVEEEMTILNVVFRMKLRQTP